MRISNFKFQISTYARTALAFGLLVLAARAFAESTLLFNGIVHTGTGETFTNGGVLIEGSKITTVLDGKSTKRLTVRQMVDLKHQHVYPGLIAVDTVLGLTELEAVRATQDTTESGEGYSPDVLSWIAVNPDSELLPVSRANGIAYFEPVPKGGIVSGQSALVSMDGWTIEQRTVQKPMALHVFWPAMQLNPPAGRRGRATAAGKSLDEQAKERRAKVRSVEDFFEEAKAYAKAKDAVKSGAASPELIPAWEAMLPYVRGELPVTVHADEERQIRSAVNWAATNHFKIILAGGRDAALVAELLATNQVPVIFEDTFTPPGRDTEPYDVHFRAPEALHRAGVKVVFGVGLESFEAPMTRNLPYAAAQAVAFGLPEDEALKGITLYPAQLAGVADRLGTIEAGKQATLFVCDGTIFDLRANVKRMWIAGREVNLESRHTKLYDRYKNRPKP